VRGQRVVQQRTSKARGRRRVAQSGAASDQPRTWLAGYEEGRDGRNRSVVRSRARRGDVHARSSNPGLHGARDVDNLGT
jgi:hypothetical protein